MKSPDIPNTEEINGKKVYFTGEGFSRKEIGAEKYRDLKLKYSTYQTKIKNLIKEKDKLEGITPEERFRMDNEQMLNTLKKLQGLQGKISSDEQNEDLDPLGIRK